MSSDNAMTGNASAAIEQARLSAKETHPGPQQITPSVAQQTHAAASDAATTAQETLGDQKAHTVDSIDQLQHEAAATTNNAAAQGQADVSGYVEKAKSLAATALATAQEYVEAGQAKLAPLAPSESTTTGTSTSGGIVETLQGAASTALGATKGVLSSAQATLSSTAQSATAAAQPHIDAASEATAPHIQAAKDTISPHVQTVQSTLAPHVQTAKEAVQPHVDAAVNTAAPYIQSAQAKLGMTGNAQPPASQEVAEPTALLEAGTAAPSQPYPAPSEGVNTQTIAENKTV